MKRHKYGSMIDGMMITSNMRWIVYSAYGRIISQHRTSAAAIASRKRHNKGCEQQGGYGDACVYQYLGVWQPWQHDR